MSDVKEVLGSYSTDITKTIEEELIGNYGKHICIHLSGIVLFQKEN